MDHAALFPFLTPLLIVAGGGLAVLGCEPFLHRATKHGVLAWLAAMTLVVALVAQVYVLRAGGGGELGTILAMDSVRRWLCAAVIGTTLVGLAGLQQSLARDDYAGGEPYALSLFAAVGAMLMVMATDLLALFVALEMTSLSVYALVGLRRHRLESNEALFKYFVMGSVFSAILLYGVALTYGATGHTGYGWAPLPGREGILHLGQLLLAIGLLFKVGAVPFHFWTADAYTGAPAAITGLMGSVIKIGGFAALGALWLHQAAIACDHASNGPLPLDAAIAITSDGQARLHDFQLIFLLLGLISVVLGNFAALKQTSSRRLIAFSSVAHAGYMLLAFALPQVGGLPLQLGALWFYLIGYGIATAGALTAIAMMAGPEDANDSLGGLAGQGRAMPLQGLVLTVFMASFAGIPPTMGFLGKYLVFQQLVATGWWKIAVFAMIMAVVGAAYYLRLTIAVWATTPKESARTGPSLLSSWTVSAAAVATIVLIAWPAMVFPHGQVAPAMPAAAPAQITTPHAPVAVLDHAATAAP